MPSRAADHSGKSIQLDISDNKANRPDSARGHHDLAGSLAAASFPLLSGSSGLKPRERIASSTDSSASGSCTTVKTRCIRLNSRLFTAAILPSFFRIRFSSTGQSICMIRIGVRIPSATVSDAVNPERLSEAGAQHEPHESPWSWSWSWSSEQVGSFGTVMILFFTKKCAGSTGVIVLNLGFEFCAICLSWWS